MRKITMAETPTAVPQDKQRSVIPFLKLENVSCSKIHARMCVVYEMYNANTTSTVNQWVQRFKAG